MSDFSILGIDHHGINNFNTSRQFLKNLFCDRITDQDMPQKPAHSRASKVDKAVKFSSQSGLVKTLNKANKRKCS